MFMESMPVSLALLRRLSFCRLQAFHFALFFRRVLFCFFTRSDVPGGFCGAVVKARAQNGAFFKNRIAGAAVMNRAAARDGAFHSRARARDCCGTRFGAGTRRRKRNSAFIRAGIRAAVFGRKTVRPLFPVKTGLSFARKTIGETAAFFRRHFR